MDKLPLGTQELQGLSAILGPAIESAELHTIQAAMNGVRDFLLRTCPRQEAKTMDMLLRYLDPVLMKGAGVPHALFELLQLPRKNAPLGRDRTAEQSFLEKILAASDDDELRLFYADWLDDHGDAEHALLIRLQCEEAALKQSDPRRVSLQAKAEEIIQKNRKEWHAGLYKFFEDRRQEGYFVAGSEYHRGFLQHLDFMDEGRFLQDEDDAEQLFQRFPFIQSIGFISIEDPEAFTRILQMPVLQNHIRGLRVSIADEAVDVAEVIASAAPEMLEELDLSHGHCRIGNEGLNLLTQSSRLQNVRTLRVNESDITADGVRLLLSQDSHIRPSVLDLSGNAIRPDGAAVIAHAPEASSLRQLFLRRSSISTEGMIQLFRSSHLTGAELLDLQYNHLGHEGSDVLRSLPPERRAQINTLHCTIGSH